MSETAIHENLILKLTSGKNDIYHFFVGSSFNFSRIAYAALLRLRSFQLLDPTNSEIAIKLLSNSPFKDCK